MRRATRAVDRRAATAAASAPRGIHHPARATPPPAAGRSAAPAAVAAAFARRRAVDCAASVGGGVALVLLNPKAKVEKLENGRVRTEVFVDAVAIKQAYNTLNNYYRGQVNIPGFRKGAPIPENILQDHVGKEQYYLAVLEEILKGTLENAFNALGDNILDGSESVETPTADMVKHVVSKTPFAFWVGGEVMPEIKWTKPYTELELEIDVSAVEKPADEKVEELIEGFRKENASMQPVIDRKVQRGDVVILEATAVDKSTGEAVLNVPDTPFKIDTDASNLPNFVENLSKLGLGEESDFEIVVPDDWEDQTVRGVTVSFHAKVVEIFGKKLPELDDALARQMNMGVSSLAEVRAMLLEQVEAGTAQEREKVEQNAITEGIASLVECNVPEFMVTEHGREGYSQKLMEMQAQGVLSPAMIQKLTSEKLVNDFIAKERDTFEMLSRASLGIQDITKRENLSANTKEINDELELAVNQYRAQGASEEEIDQERITAAITERFEAKAVFDWLKENAKITFKTAA